MTALFKALSVVALSLLAAGGPETGLIEKTMRGESSDVLPLGSVAVTVTC